MSELDLFLTEFKELCVKYNVNGDYPDDYHPEFIMNNGYILTDMIDSTKAGKP